MIGNIASKKIEALVGELEDYIASKQEILQDGLNSYYTINEFIFLEEIQQELPRLKETLSDPASFSDFFRERCKFRISNPESLSFLLTPESKLNEIYWKIALELFNPQNLQAMFSILLPTIDTFLDVGMKPIPAKLAVNEIREVLKKPEVELSLKNTIDGPVDVQELSHFVFSDNLAFDVRTIKHFSFDMHYQLFQLLSQQYPGLAEQLYHRNSDLVSLWDDIAFFDNKGKTPAEALKFLAKTFTLTGNRASGEEYVLEEGQQAFKHFLHYFKLLPRELRLELKQLEGKRSLAKIIQHLKEGDCVEEGSSYINSLLELNENNAFLHTIPAMTKEERNKIQKKYSLAMNKEGISSLRNKNSLEKIITPFLKKILKNCLQVSPKNIEEFSYLLVNFPAENYGLLLENINLDNYDIKELFTIHLQKIINQDFFSEEQRVALANALVAQKERFFADTDILAWSAMIKYKEFICTIIQSMPDEESLAIAEKVDFKRQNNTLFHNAAQYTDAFAALFSLYSTKQEKKAAIRRLNNQGYSLWHSAANTPNSLLFLFDLYDDQDELDNDLEQVDNNGLTVFHCAAGNAISLKILFDRYGRDKILLISNNNNTYKKTLLHCAYRNPESIRLILSLHKSISLILSEDSSGCNTFHKAIGYKNSIAVYCQELLLDELEKVLESENKRGNSGLHYLAQCYPETFKNALSFIPEDLRFKFLQKIDSTGLTVLEKTFEKTESFDNALSVLSANDKRLALVEASEEGHSALSKSIEKESSNILNIILKHNDAEYVLELLNKEIYLPGKKVYVIPVEIFIDNFPKYKHALMQTFLSDYFSILHELQKVSKKASYYFFKNSHANEAKLLLTTLRELRHFEDVKLAVVNYIAQHSSSPVSSVMIDAFVSRSVEEDRFVFLQNSWGMANIIHYGQEASYCLIS